MPRRSLLAALAPFLLAGSSGCFIVIDDDDDDLPGDTSEVLVRASCPGSAAVVDEVTLAGDTMVVTASYGGCGATRIWACWDGAFLESYPVQVPIRIHHEPAGDCDAWITQTEEIALDPVIDAYVDSYGGLDPIVLNVGGESVTWEP